MSPFRSTGTLPPDADVQQLVEAAHAANTGVTEGHNSRIYPTLERADSALFGLSVVSVSGEVFNAGDVTTEFVLMSVSKPFVFALLCADRGAEGARELIGVDPTGRAFNSVRAVIESADGRTNPMVNPGAIATSSHIGGDDVEHRWQRIKATLEGFAGRELALDEEVYASVVATNTANRALAAALAERGRLGTSEADALELYTRQCCLLVNAKDIAVMGATLADGGRNPLTGVQVIEPALVEPVLAVMATSGLYEHSGRWLFSVGVPAKSGISGGIVSAAPGKAGVGSYSPPLDAAGNSVRGIRAAYQLSKDLGLSLLASAPLQG